MTDTTHSQPLANLITTYAWARTHLGLPEIKAARAAVDARVAELEQRAAAPSDTDMLVEQLRDLVDQLLAAIRNDAWAHQAAGAGGVRPAPATCEPRTEWLQIHELLRKLESALAVEMVPATRTAELERNLAHWQKLAAGRLTDLEQTRQRLDESDELANARADRITELEAHLAEQRQQVGAAAGSMFAIGAAAQEARQGIRARDRRITELEEQLTDANAEVTRLQQFSSRTCTCTPVRGLGAPVRGLDVRPGCPSHDLGLNNSSFTDGEER